MDGRRLLTEWAEALPVGADERATITALRHAVHLPDTATAAQMLTAYENALRDRTPERWRPPTEDHKRVGRRAIAEIRRKLETAAA